MSDSLNLRLTKVTVSHRVVTEWSPLGLSCEAPDLGEFLHLDIMEVGRRREAVASKGNIWWRSRGKFCLCNYRFILSSYSCARSIVVYCGSCFASPNNWLLWLVVTRWGFCWGFYGHLWQQLLFQRWSPVPTAPWRQVQLCKTSPDFGDATPGPIGIHPRGTEELQKHCQISWNPLKKWTHNLFNKNHWTILLDLPQFSQHLGWREVPNCTKAVPLQMTFPGDRRRP